MNPSKDSTAIQCCTAYRRLLYNSLCLVLFVFIGFSSVGCGNDSNGLKTMDKEEIALDINGNIITMEEFTELINLENSVNPEFDLAPDKKKKFIDYLIQKEMLIHEASRRKLDHQKDFLRTIERYWESTLIRNLMSRKSRELEKEVSILATDIQAYYDANKTDTTPPLDNIKEEIRQQLHAERVNLLIDKWEQELVQSAKIYKNPLLLK